MWFLILFGVIFVIVLAFKGEGAGGTAARATIGIVLAIIGLLFLLVMCGAMM